jgi:hypothetical protein
VHPYELEDWPLYLSEDVIGTLMEIALNIQVTFDSAAIFTILIMLVYDHGVSFHLLISSLIIFTFVIYTVNYISFPCFVNFCVVLEIEVRAYTFSHSTSPFLWWVLSR